MDCLDWLYEVIYKNGPLSWTRNYGGDVLTFQILPGCQGFTHTQITTDLGYGNWFKKCTNLHNYNYHYVKIFQEKDKEYVIPETLCSIFKNYYSSQESRFIC